MEIPIQPMTAAEALAWVTKHYGTYDEYKRTQAGDPAIDRELATAELKRELQKYDGNAEELLKRDPGVYDRLRRDIQVKVGVQVKD